MIAPYSSRLSWNQQLMAQQIGRETSAPLKQQLVKQTTDIIASHRSLEREFGSGFDALNQTLEWGLSDIATAVEDLRAEFSYGISLVLAQLEVQNRTLNNILETLEAIHESVITPVQTRAQEFFREGYQLLARNLLFESVDYLNRGLSEYDVDFLAHYHLGLLYLYGQDGNESPVELPRAVHHLRLSARYANSMRSQMEDANRYERDALFQASIACYAIAGELRRTGDFEASSNELRAALDFACSSIEVDPANADAHYHIAKYHALLNHPEAMQMAIRDASVLDYRVALKASFDDDFEDVREAYIDVMNDLRLELREVASRTLDCVTTWKNDLATVVSSQYWPEGRCATDAINILDGLRHEIERALQENTYLDHVHALQGFRSNWLTGLESSLRDDMGDRLTDHIIELLKHEQRVAFALTLVQGPSIATNLAGNLERIKTQTPNATRSPQVSGSTIWTQELLKVERKRADDAISSARSLIPDSHYSKSDEMHHRLSGLKKLSDHDDLGTLLATDSHIAEFLSQLHESVSVEFNRLTDAHTSQKNALISRIEEIDSDRDNLHAGSSWAINAGFLAGLISTLGLVVNLRADNGYVVFWVTFTSISYVVLILGFWLLWVKHRQDTEKTRNQSLLMSPTSEFSLFESVRRVYFDACPDTWRKLREQRLEPFA